MLRSRTWILRQVSRSLPPLLAFTLAVFAGCGSTSAATSATTGGATSAAPTATSTAAPAATSTSAGLANATTIKITGAAGSFAFQPATVSIKAGTTVVWVNDTGTLHTSTSDSSDAISWDSSAITVSGGSYSFTFSKPGTYPYHCAFHPFMHGSITVTS